MLRFANVCAVAMLACGCAAAEFTLEQVMSAPFPAELTGAPSGGKLAWVLNTRGVRNIWVAEPPDYRARQVTAYSDDDGQELLDLVWTPDARSIVYVRGDRANRGGEHPNPAIDPRGVRQAVWVVSVEGGAPREIGEGASPAISPKGDRVAFVRQGQIWAAALEGPAKPEHWIHARGQNGELRWSPDGSALAFVSSRGDHAFVGVYRIDGGTLRYLEPSVDRDTSPAWSADGKRIAFIRLPTYGRENYFRPLREGPPWSIHVAEIESGKGREVWKARQGGGSVFRAIDSPDQLRWASGGRLVFPWEGDGWTHLYSVSVDGGEPALLTPGAFEVEHAALLRDRETMVYSSNQGDIDRRHLWQVRVTGGAPSPLTSGDGIEWGPVTLSDHRIALLRSDARVPARPALLDGKTLRDLAPEAIPASFPRGQMAVPQAVVFAGADGLRIHGQVFPPARRSGEPGPAVIFFHGGSRRQMLLGWHYMYYYRNAYALNQYLASRGYLVLSVNYRSGIGYGMEFREALHYGPTGASEYNDVQGAGLYLRSRPDVDPARIGLWGGSYGGYLTALGLARASGLFAAGVDFHGVHDWSTELTYAPQQADAARVAFESSPMAAVRNWRSPVLLIHGDDDRNVKFTQTTELADALRRQGVAFEQLIFPDEVHDFLLHRNWLEAYRRAAAFFDRNLLPGPGGPERGSNRLH